MNRTCACRLSGTQNGSSSFAIPGGGRTTIHVGTINMGSESPGSPMNLGSVRCSCCPRRRATCASSQHLNLADRGLALFPRALLAQKCAWALCYVAVMHVQIISGVLSSIGLAGSLGGLSPVSVLVNHLRCNLGVGNSIIARSQRGMGSPRCSQRLVDWEDSKS